MSFSSKKKVICQKKREDTKGNIYINNMIVTTREVAFVHYMSPLKTLKLNPQDFWQGKKV